METKAKLGELMATKEKLVELMWEHRLWMAAVVAFVATAVVSISAIGPRLRAVFSFFWPLLVSTGFFLVTITVLLWISPPPAGDDESGKDLIVFVAGCRPEHLILEAAASVDVPPEPEI